MGMGNFASYIDISRLQMTPLEQQWYQDKVQQDEKDKKEYETVYRPGQQQTHADKQKEIANMLSGLPNFTAYTKVGGNVKYCPTCLTKLKDKEDTCHTCGATPKFNAEFQSCWSCGTKPDP